MIEKLLYVSALAIMFVAVIPTRASSQFRNVAQWPLAFADTLPQVRQDNIYADPAWLVASIGFDFATPSLGTAPLPFFVSYKLGVANNNILYSLAYHGAKGTFISDMGDDPGDDYRHDFAFLVGLTKSKVPLSWSVSAGLCVIDYSFRGNEITNGSNGGSVTYDHRTGTTLGVAASANYMYLPVENVGVGGLGFYGSLSQGASYIALEISMLQLNIPM